MRQEIAYNALDRVTEVHRFVPPDATTPAYVEAYAYNALGAISVYDGAVVDHQRPPLNDAIPNNDPSKLGAIRRLPCH